MINKCYECAHSIEKQKNSYVCQIRETIENSPITFYDGCPFFEPRNLNLELIKLALKNREGELIKCDCGGIYKWTGSIKLSYPPQYVFCCDKCNSDVTIRAERLFPEQYPEFQKK